MTYCLIVGSCERRNFISLFAMQNRKQPAPVHLSNPGDSQRKNRLRRHATSVKKKMERSILFIVRCQDNEWAPCLTCSSLGHHKIIFKKSFGFYSEPVDLLLVLSKVVQAKVYSALESSIVGGASWTHHVILPVDVFIHKPQN